MEMVNAIGRRKGSVARVYATSGKGGVIINGKELKEYFPQPHIHNKVLAPFELMEGDNIYDWNVNVAGGGFKGQAEAVRMGISRILVKINEDNRKPLKDMKFLRRDARVVERKKYGKPKARKSFQFSKR
ncbi:MAG: 30S ribosomal protein S9 [Saprospiraceae bacterium]|nr:30S ribosomal protein S9 [Saprospiraceae bacterium]